jgi:hypothetical protein
MPRPFAEHVGSKPVLAAPAILPLLESLPVPVTGLRQRLLL